MKFSNSETLFLLCVIKPTKFWLYLSVTTKRHICKSKWLRFQNPEAKLWEALFLMLHSWRILKWLCWMKTNRSIIFIIIVKIFGFHFESKSFIRLKLESFWTHFNTILFPDLGPRKWRPTLLLSRTTRWNSSDDTTNGQLSPPIWPRSNRFVNFNSNFFKIFRS